MLKFGYDNDAECFTLEFIVPNGTVEKLAEKIDAYAFDEAWAELDKFEVQDFWFGRAADEPYVELTARDGWGYLSVGLPEAENHETVRICCLDAKANDDLDPGERWMKYLNTGTAPDPIVEHQWMEFLIPMRQTMQLLASIDVELDPAAL